MELVPPQNRKHNMKYLLMVLALAIARPSEAQSHNRLQHVTKAEVVALELDQMLTHKRDSINAYRDSINAYRDSINAYHNSVQAYRDAVRAQDSADSVEACTQDSACHAEQIRVAEAEQQAKIAAEAERQAEIAAEADRKANYATFGRILGIISLIVIIATWLIGIYYKKDYLNVYFVGIVLIIGFAGLVFCGKSGDGKGFVAVSALFIVAIACVDVLQENKKEKDAVTAAIAKEAEERAQAERLEADRKAAEERREADRKAAEERREARKAAEERRKAAVFSEDTSLDEAISIFESMSTRDQHYAFNAALIKRFEIIGSVNELIKQKTMGALSSEQSAAIEKYNSAMDDLFKTF